MPGGEARKDALVYFAAGGGTAGAGDSAAAVGIAAGGFCQK